MAGSGTGRGVSGKEELDNIPLRWILNKAS